jgi:hypothetical protein
MTNDAIQAVHDERVRILNAVTKLFKDYVVRNDSMAVGLGELLRVTALGVDVQAACVGEVRS